MNFETFSVIVDLGLIALLVWFGFWLYWTKNAIKSQKEIITSFQSQSEYLKNIQDLLSGIYNIDDIQKIIEVREEKLKQTYEEEFVKTKQELDRLRKEKSSLQETIKEYKSNGQDDHKKISLFGHNILVTFLFYYISLQKLIIHTRMGLSLYSLLYEKHFSKEGPVPEVLDERLRNLQDEIELELEPLSIDEMRVKDLGVHNELYPNFATWDFDELSEKVINVRESYSKYLVEHFESED